MENGLRLCLTMVALACCILLFILVEQGKNRPSPVGPCVQWEYKHHHFGREDGSWAKPLGAMSAGGWKFGGTLSNNGINARYVVFTRCIKRAE